MELIYRPKKDRDVTEITWLQLPSYSYPKVFEDVLLYTNKGHITIGYLAKRRPEKLWFIYNPELDDEKIIAWARLPIPPEFREEYINKD